MLWTLAPVEVGFTLPLMALMLLCGFWHMLWTIVHFRIRKVGAQKKSYRAGGDTVKKSDGEQKQEGKAGKRGV